MKGYLEVCIAALLVLIATKTTVAGADDAASQTKTGVVRSVDPAAGTVVVMAAREMSFAVTGDTQIVEDGAARTLADIKAGAAVTVVYSFAAGRSRVASKVTITAPSPAAAPASADVRVSFTLNTNDPHGVALRQNRFYWVYRPRGLPTTTRAPIVLLMDGRPPTMLHRKADQAHFLAVSYSFSGNSTGTPGKVWINDDPRVCGYEDFDYVTEVINRVRASENGGDAFVVGLSKGGHMSLAYACERPDMIRAAASLNEFMGLTTNRPTAPLPLIVFQGTSDINVPYTMVKDTLDAWRALDGLLNTEPVTTYESSPRIPGSVSQATWQGGIDGSQVAFVSIVGGTHTYPLPEIQTGYDFTDGVWAFFSQFLTNPPVGPTVVSQPLDNVQPVGQPASFRVVAAGADPLRYQWQRNGRDIPGATESWYTIPAVTPADRGASFRAVVSNAAGSATSSGATLTVTAASAGPTIGVQPASLTVAAGRPATFTVSATGVPPFRYQWRRNGVNIEGATEVSYCFPLAAPFDSGASFSVVVGDRTGTAVSAPATLTVTRSAGAPIILTNPARVRLLVGQSGNFSVDAWSRSPLRYQWQKGTFTGHMTDIPGATELTYRTPRATLADHHTLFRCIVSNSAGSVASASEMLLVTTELKPPTDITSAITADAQAGARFSYTIVSSGGTLPLWYSAEPLPPGLSVDPVSGKLSGTPTEVGATHIEIGAANSAGRVSATVLLTVIADPPPLSIESWRSTHFRAIATDPAIAGVEADPDGDGYSNIEELRRNSDPLDSR